MVIAGKAEADLRELLAIPADYKVLFLQGGALAQNAMVPLNLLRADGVRRLRQHRRMVEEGDRRSAASYGRVNVAALERADRSSPTSPPQSTWQLSARRRLRPLCTNETIGGVEFHCDPATRATCRWWPTCPRTSCRGRSTSRASASIYAGAQKNIGPAGLTLVIVREDLIGRARRECPSVFDYKMQADGRFDVQHAADVRLLCRRPGVPVAEAQGGLAAIERVNIAKAECSTRRSTQRASTATRSRHADRSRMNVPFFLRDERLDEPFLDGREGARAGAAEGPPLGRRHARVDLQRDAARRACRRWSSTCANSSGSTAEPMARSMTTELDRRLRGTATRSTHSTTRSSRD